jgi:hypothetical protein
MRSSGIASVAWQSAADNAGKWRARKKAAKTRPGAGKSPALGGSSCRPLRPTTNLCTGRPTSRISPDRAGWLPRTPGRSCPRPSGKDRTGPRRSTRSTACPRTTPPDDLGAGQVFLGFSGTQSERLPKSFAGRHTDEPAGRSSLAVRHAGGQFTAGGLAKPGTSQAVSLRFGDDRLDLGQFPHWMPPRLGEYPPTESCRSGDTRSASAARSFGIARRESTTAPAWHGQANRRPSCGPCPSETPV